MKSLRYIASSAVLAAGMMAGQPAAFATDSPAIPAGPASNLTPTTQGSPDQRLREAISAIERAPDPSSVVDAYAKGAALDRDGVAVEQAYVRRLVALGLPEMAESQARDLSKRRPDDGLAWAVVAYTDARRGDTPLALQDILIAARQAGDDPFVQRTAAQLLAYYDYKADRTKIDRSVRDALEQMRNNLRGRTEYAQAYEKASDAYEHGAVAAATEPSGPDYVAPSDPYAGSSPPAVYNYTYNTYTSEAAPYTDPYAYYYGDYPYWPSWWWWGPSFVVIDRPFFFRHRFDHDRFDHRFDHDRFDHNRFDHDRFDHNRFDHDRFDHNRFDRDRSFGHDGFGNRFDRGSSLRDGRLDGVHRFDGSRLGAQRSLPPQQQFRSAPHQFRAAPAPQRLAPSRAMPRSRGGSAMPPSRGSMGGGGRMSGGASRGGGGGGRR